MQPDGDDGGPNPQAGRAAGGPGPRRERASKAARNVAELKGSYRYGLVLMLAVLSTGVQMALPDTPPAWLIQALLMGATVITALFAEDATRRQWRQVGWLIGLSLLAAFVAALTGSDQAGRGVMFGLSGLLAIAGRGDRRARRRRRHPLERRVTLHSVMGALTVYLLAGLIFAFAYSVMGAIAGSPVLSHIGSDKHAEEVYFSFITLTTVGYGDIAPVAAASRMTSVLEALFGQLYLVTIVAVIVSNVGAVRMRQAAPDEDPAGTG